MCRQSALTHFSVCLRDDYALLYFLKNKCLENCEIFQWFPHKFLSVLDYTIKLFSHWVQRIPYPLSVARHVDNHVYFHLFFGKKVKEVARSRRVSSPHLCAPSLCLWANGKNKKNTKDIYINPGINIRNSPANCCHNFTLSMGFQRYWHYFLYQHFNVHKMFSLSSCLGLELHSYWEKEHP